MFFLIAVPGWWPGYCIPRDGTNVISMTRTWVIAVITCLIRVNSRQVSGSTDLGPYIGDVHGCGFLAPLGVYIFVIADCTAIYPAFFRACAWDRTMFSTAGSPGSR